MAIVRLLDTNVVSYIMRKHPLAEKYLALLEEQPQSISFMTAAELYEGAQRANWGAKRLMFLEQELAKYVHYPSTLEICRIWARVRSDRRRQPISAQDAFIAATALAHSCPLVTHNPADFQGIADLKMITAL